MMTIRHMLAALVRHWPMNQRDQFEDYAARLEFGDGFSRAEAERRAEEMIRDEWNRHQSEVLR